MFLVYTHKITPRIRYIFKHIFENMLMINLDITNDVQIFVEYSGNHDDDKYDIISLPNQHL